MAKVGKPWPALAMFSLAALASIALAGCEQIKAFDPTTSSNQTTEDDDGAVVENDNSQPEEVSEVSDGNDTGGEFVRPVGPVSFDEPAGITYAAGKLYVADTNNHQIRVIDLKNGYKASTLVIEGLKPPLFSPEGELIAGPPIGPPEKPEPPKKDPPVEDDGEEVDEQARAETEDDPRLATPSPPVPPGVEEKPEMDEDLLALRHPFADAPDFAYEFIDFPDGHEWLNTKPLKLKDLKGKFVLIDFWTYCCINCIHILPELKKLERKYPNELVVIGVHSAKFDTEKGTKNIEEAILRYEIEHPVVNDPEHKIWNQFRASSWPTVALISPDGKFLGKLNGEFEHTLFDRLFQGSLPYYREHKLLDETPTKYDLLKHKQKSSPLKFPGKVLADLTGRRLFIADSNHNRIVVSTLEGKLLQTIGTGAIGQDDGSYAKATFNKPQGMALLGNVLYVADTENHMIRKIDLKAKRVSTIAGTGKQGRNPWPGFDRTDPLADLPERFVTKPKGFSINSPWALLIHNNDLFIAMAGPHQIWKMTLDEKEIGPYAGNGREDIVDGPLLPRFPYAEGASSFAQPSGLTTNGKFIYVADSEGSSIRAVPIDQEAEVETVLGTAHLPRGRLFEFGHVDGQGEAARFQHCLGVVHHEGKLYVADGVQQRHSRSRHYEENRHHHRG